MKKQIILTLYILLSIHLFGQEKFNSHDFFEGNRFGSNGRVEEIYSVITYANHQVNDRQNGQNDHQIKIHLIH
jgi:hypothetical protein